MTAFTLRFLFPAGICMLATLCVAEEFHWQMRAQQSDDGTAFRRTTREETWPANATAFIVCDVWDKHHCLNAVRRLEEFGPRLNDVLTEARRRGAIIIHAPSDCMPAYTDHPARKRAESVAKTTEMPPGIARWCSRIPTEELAVYPIDQSDGGEDDDPEEHARWAAELKAMGRNPAMPWKTQSPMITIDATKDYITDRGDEVWNILQKHQIDHVVLTGVHTNMCVLGRPFGLRQMVRQGKNVVLMRDMTDCMYNPKRWPFVDHFTGNDLIISHVERFVCPTVTSDQVLGGRPFRFAADTRPVMDIMSVDVERLSPELLRKQWCVVPIPSRWTDLTEGKMTVVPGTVWYRAALVPSHQSLQENEKGEVAVLTLTLPRSGTLQVWMNGQEIEGFSPTGIRLPDTGTPVFYGLRAEHFAGDDASLLVIRSESRTGEDWLLNSEQVPTLGAGCSLQGRWQVRIGDDPAWFNMPLPAKFGAATDIVIDLNSGSAGEP